MRFLEAAACVLGLDDSVFGLLVVQFIQLSTLQDWSGVNIKP